MWLQDCILPTFLLSTPLDWVEYISVRKCSLWKSITAVQPVPSLAAVSTGDDHKERETANLRSSCSCSGQSLTERQRWTQTEADDSFWILNILSQLGSRFSGESHTAAVCHEFIVTTLMCRLWLLQEDGFWWRQMVAGKEGWLKK